MKEHEKLLQKAVESIGRAKRLHDDLESYYIPNMKFNEVEKIQQDILNKLLQ